MCVLAFVSDLGLPVLSPLFVAVVRVGQRAMADEVVCEWLRCTNDMNAASALDEQNEARRPTSEGRHLRGSAFFMEEEQNARSFDTTPTTPRKCQKRCFQTSTQSLGTTVMGVALGPHVLAACARSRARAERVRQRQQVQAHIKRQPDQLYYHTRVQSSCYHQ